MKLNEIVPGHFYDHDRTREVVFVLDVERMYRAELSKGTRAVFELAPDRRASSSMFSTTGLLAIEPNIGAGEFTRLPASDDYLAIAGLLRSGQIEQAIDLARTFGQVTLVNPRRLLPQP